MLEQTLLYLPTILAIASIAMFNEKTRWYCYTLVMLSIISELIPATINTTALIACVAALVALLFMDLLHHFQITRDYFVTKSH